MDEVIKNRIVLIAKLLCVVVVIFIAWFYLSRGFIVIKDPNNTIESVRYIDINSFSINDTKSPKSIFTNGGDYSIRIELKDGSYYVKQISVPAFLGTIEVTPKSNTNQISIVDYGSLSEVSALDESNIKNYDYDGNFSDINNTNQTKTTGIDNIISSFYDGVPIGDRYIGGLVRDSEANNTPTIYDFNNKKSTSYKALPTSDSKYNLRAYDRGFAVYDQNNKTVSIYSLDQKELQILNINKDIKPAHLDNQVIFDINNTKVAILEGNNIISGGDINEGATTSADIKPSVVHIIDRNNKKIVVKLQKKEKYSGVRISPDGSYLVLSTENSIYIHSVESSKLIFFMNIKPESIKWSGDDSFLLANSTQGIFNVDIKSKEAKSIMPATILSLTSLGNIFNNRLYFTAFTENDSGAVDPNIYTLDLGQETHDDNVLIKKFPVYNPGYKIEVKNDKTLIVTIKPGFMDVDGEWVDEETIRASANNYIKNNLKNIEKYNVEYSYDLALVF